MSQYAPAPVPYQLADIPAYLSDELNRIAEQVNAAVDAAYGGMISQGQTTLALTTAPQTLDVFADLIPAVPVGVLVDVAGVLMTVLTAGSYVATFNGTLSDIANGTQVFIEFRVNGSQVRTIVIDPSNQTAFSNATISVIRTFERGDILSAVVFIDSGTDSVTFEDCTFHMVRVSPSDD